MARVRVIGLFLVCLSFLIGPLSAPAEVKPDGTNAGLTATVSQQVAAIMDRAETGGDFQQASEEATALFARVVAYGDTKAPEQFVEAAYAYRLLSQLAGAEGLSSVEMLRYLRANPKFGHALAFLIQPGEDPAKVYALADRLRRGHGDVLNDFATLAAAICVVHDEPLKRRVNENEVAATDPIELFNYFRNNEKRMLFGIRTVPAELLVYVVDSTASIQEMNWALKRYNGDRAVGKRFFDIQYDTAHFRQGTQKKVTSAGYNLPNILEYGGVCADQAYFAVSVGKAIGVPTAYTRGRSGEVGHAWVGFLQADGARAAWNFDEGRYEVYRGVRGVIEDPQTRQYIPDSVASLLAVMIGSGTADREAAAALIDAAQLLHMAESAQAPFTPQPLTTPGSRDQPRSTDTATQLELLEAGLRSCPGYDDGWWFLAYLASQGKLSLDQKKKWSGVLMNLCGDRYPDFTLAVLEPMIATIDDPQEQAQLWNKAGELVEKRKDLSAEVLMAKGKMWEAQGELVRAGQCYERIVDHFLNDGPFVLDALDQIEPILLKSGKTEQVLTMYNQVWSRVQAPERMAPAFRTQSNWYKIGARYAERLRAAGYTERAAQAEAQIKRVTGG